MYRKQVNSGTNLRLSAADGCCPDGSNPICAFEFQIEELTAITSITIDGVVVTITATDETDVGQISQAIADALLAQGYFPDGVYPTIEVYYDVWNLSTWIRIYAAASTITMITVPAATINGDKACIEGVACRYTFEVPVGAGLDINLSDENVEESDPGNSPQNVADDYPTGGADDLASDLYDAFVALYAGTTNATVKRIKVVENLATDKYEVQVWLYGHQIPALDDELIGKCECKIDYTVAN